MFNIRHKIRVIPLLNNILFRKVAHVSNWLVFNRLLEVPVNVLIILAKSFVQKA